ncbi:MAG TPA: hypothetical protein VEI54_03470 [Candidatus Limnocylindrales bacterium]|nr:hypothetical protein [Candidatus Limnocylindrales bacterium]
MTNDFAMPASFSLDNLRMQQNTSALELVPVTGVRFTPPLLISSKSTAGAYYFTPT